jgi:tetratricopeptide (TPR) repeat protein
MEATVEIPRARWTAGTAEHAQLVRRRAEETLRDVAASLGEQSAEGALARGKMFELVGYFPEAVAAYSDALAIDADLREARARRALSQLKAGHVGQALETATDLAARHPDYVVQALTTDERVSAMTILGDALLANDRIDDARVAYEQARSISEEDS